MRKPRPLLRFSGVPLSRFADLQIAAVLLQLPPRNTQNEPRDGPTGSINGPLGYLLSYQSEHHSHTDPYPS